jgi:hypothetical protein
LVRSSAGVAAPIALVLEPEPAADLMRGARRRDNRQIVAGRDRPGSAVYSS